MVLHPPAGASTRTPVPDGAVPWWMWMREDTWTSRHQFARRQLRLLLCLCVL
eukprot:COSAG03_NODE_1753_length_3569_cov_2.545821_4_plen_51_part_01